MKSAIFIFAIASLSSAAHCASAEQNLLACSAIKNEAERLSCYDRAADEATPATMTTAAGTGKWLVSEDINPLNDSKTVTLVLPSESEATTLSRDRVGLVIRCQNFIPALYIVWHEYLGSETIVTTRVGAATATTSEWLISSDSQASFHRDPTVLITQMMGQARFVAQTTPYGENPVTAVFDISGIDEALKPLKEVCSW